MRLNNYLEAQSVLAADVEGPSLKVRRVLDVGPDEAAFIVVGVAATALNIDKPDEVDGSGATATTSASSQQIHKG